MNVKNLVLGVGIVIVFALVLWQGIEAFYPSPQWGDFCDISVREPFPPEEPNRSELSKDIFSECQSQYDEARSSHAQIVFIISLIVAIAVIITGYSVLSIEPVGSSLIASGIWAIFWGSVINWRNFSNIWRFLLLLLVLVLLIYITIRLNKPKSKKKKKKRK